MATENITLAVEPNLKKKAKVLAAKHDTSINALFTSHLVFLLRTAENAEQNHNANFKTLLDFSLGNLTFTDAMRKLGIDSKEQLFLFMCAAQLPMPKLPEEETLAMVDDMDSFIAEAEAAEARKPAKRAP